MKRFVRFAVLGVTTLATLLLANDAQAFEFGTKQSEHPYRSAQNFALELRFSPYRPQVDQEPGIQGTPFADSFGTKPRLYFGIEFDWQVYRIPYVGTIGPGETGCLSVASSRSTAARRSCIASSFLPSARSTQAATTRLWISACSAQ